MKKNYAAALCLCLLLSACAPSGGQPPEQAAAAAQSSETKPVASEAAASQEAQKSNTPVLYFSGELPDPQSMVPTYEPGTLTFEGTFTPLAKDSYEAALHLTRYFPQGINFVTGEPQPEGYMNLCIGSCWLECAACRLMRVKPAREPAMRWRLPSDMASALWATRWQIRR